LKFIQPDLYLSVLDPATEDFKTSAKRYLEKADAVILHRNGKRPSWAEIDLGTSERPVFVVKPPGYVTAEIVEFVESALTSALCRP
jgi:hypothetical protein